MINFNFAAARRGIESMYRGLCSVYEKSGVKNETTKITKFSDSAIVSNQPCLLSYESINTVTAAPPGKLINQTIKLFLSPDITVLPGSKITVTQDGVTGKYTSSGLPAVYPTHQEIILKAGGWA